MGKLLDNGFFKRSKNLQMLILIFLLSIPFVMSQKKIQPIDSGFVIEKTKKIDSYKKMQENKQREELYKEILETKERTALPQVNIHGTEYRVGDNATVFLQLLNESSKYPINNALCYLDIYFPNKTQMFDEVGMMYLLGSDGLYYYDLVIPDGEGVYMLSAKCNFYHNVTYSPPEQDSYVWDSNPLINYGISPYLMIQDNFYAECSYVQFDLAGLILPIENATLFLYKPFNLLYQNSTMVIQRVTSSWDELTITWSNQPSVDNHVWSSKDVSQSLGWFDIDVTDLVTSWVNGTYTDYGMMLNVTENASDFRMFYSSEYVGDYKPRLMIVYYTSQYVQEIRGSGELHVSGNITANVDYNYFDNQFNQTQENQQTIYSFVQTMNTTLVTGQEYIKTKVNDIWDYVQEVIEGLFMQMD